ncbi:hypothetical protein [Hymenobacter persicinus]|uniref:Uncharacterized protein n=1 Tax=Hymenobacter persicinus TaxID=2025506 RepID=A0A4Q5L9W2_9BACT|nr:hypothetical protein [Hymenobacter persicinus]RYU77698.1 hypothetical protein EWM57_17050 [Hymenobacter persicinus]
MSVVREPAAIFSQLLFAAIFGLAIGVVTLWRGHKRREDFYTLTGAVTNLTNSLNVEGHLNLNNEPLRYLQVQGQSRFFRLFIGEDLDGSKPNYQRIDDIKVGDIVTVYYDETLWSSSSDLVSNLAYFVDKDQQPYFIRGSLNNRTGYYFMGACAIVALASIYLKRTGKIA